MGCAVCLLVLNFICVCLALAGNVAALTGYSWWKMSNYEKGLFRHCSTPSNGDQSCDFDTEMFDDPQKFVDRFIVVVLLIASCGMIFFSLIATLSMFCCLKSRGCWCCGAGTVSLKLFIGAGAGIAAMVYSEIQFANDFKNFERGWSNIVGWIGSGIGLIAFFLSCAMCCVKPKRYSGGNVNVVVNPPYAMGPGKEIQMVNRGYQHGY